MELYVKVSFWIGIVGVVLRTLIMLGGSYPRTTENTAASDTVLLLLGIGFAVWSGFLVYGG